MLQFLLTYTVSSTLIKIETKLAGKWAIVDMASIPVLQTRNIRAVYYSNLRKTMFNH